MASTSETGHTKNIAHFEQLISFCTGYGAAYNPTNAPIKITAMKAKLTAAKAAMAQVPVTNIAYQNAVNARFTAFAGLKTLATRVVNALVVSGATTATIADARTLNRKIQGKRAKPAVPKMVEGTETPKDPVSASQQSFDKLIEHFFNLIELLSQEPLYTPNETDLKLTALQTFRDTLANLNSAVLTAYTPVSNDRIARDTILYAEGTGMVDVAITAKNYIKAVFGSSGAQYNQVKGLEFKNIKSGK